MTLAGAQSLVSATDVERALREGALDIVFHPIVRLATGVPLGSEALARLADPTIPPAQLFAAAKAAGLERELELLAIRRGLAEAAGLPDDQLIFINASAATVVSPEFDVVVAGAALPRLVIDLSAASDAADESALAEALAHLRATGVRLSIDDAGDDRTTWRRIEKFEPEVIKLGPALTWALADNADARRAAAHFLAFAADIHADVIAEAIETEAQRAQLVDLGVSLGQGFLFGKPAALTLPSTSRR